MSRSPLLTALPLELVRIIIELVASHSEHQATAASLLLVSKTVHAWVLPLRSRTVVLSGLYVERFVELARKASFFPFLSQIERLCLLDIHQYITSSVLTSALTPLRPDCRLAIPAARLSALDPHACLCTHVFLITSAWAFRAPSAYSPLGGPRFRTMHPSAPNPSATPARTGRPSRFRKITHLAIGPDAPNRWQGDLRRAIPLAFPSLTHLAIIVRVQPFVLREDAGGEDAMQALLGLVRDVLYGRLQRVYVRLYKWDMLRGIEDPSVASDVENLRGLLAGLRDPRVFVGSAPMPRRRLDSETFSLWALGDTPWEDGQPVFPSS